MNGVLENGPLFIRSAPIILKKWTPNANLIKEDLNSVPFWVKLHDIPIMAFAADGLSVMDTKLDNPIMLDSYTRSMCLQSWGHMDYAHALIDIRANRELKKDMVIAIHNVKDDGEVMKDGYNCGDVGVSLITFDVLQRFGFFLQMGFTLILATLDGLDVGLLGDVIGGDDCDDDE
ncbi:probable indole-3-pyruvate monooxygenase YUCCA10 [Tanacetum coccineum]